MSGPIKMYAMRQIVRHDVPVTLPTCMYSLSKLPGAIDTDGADVAAKRKNGTATGRAQPTSPSSNSVELVAEQYNQATAMAAVHQRQELLLRQLEHLRKQMTGIRDSLKSAGATCRPSPSVRSGKLNVKQLPSEISIYINPANPPYSIFLLQKVWKNEVNINIKFYVHSTVNIVPESGREFFQSRPEPQTISNLPSLMVRLIWKNIGINHLEVSGSRPIQGEVNLLRFLARLTSSLSYDEDSEMDSYLDTCYSITRSKTKSERLPLLQRLNKKLGKEKFIFGAFSIVDVAAYSAIKQTAGAGEINVGMTKWMKSCENCN